jgi:hypothetical protein
MRLRFSVLAFGATLTMIWSALAGAVPMPLDGVINFTGSNTYNSTTHVVDFINPATVASDTIGFATCIDCVIIANGTAGVFDYSAAVPAPPTKPLVYNALLMATNGGLTFSFDLATITSVTETANSLVIDGTGIMHLTGFGAAPGSFYFSTQGPGTLAEVSFSSTAVSGAVPEPGSLMLLGSALLGLGCVVRRRGNAA